MDKDYQLNELLYLINKIDSDLMKDQSWLIRRRHLNALFTYFQYSIASVRMQEENLKKKNMIKNSSSMDEEIDYQLKIYSAAIGAYSNLRTCLNFTLSVINTIPIARQSQALKVFRNAKKEWVQDVIERRDFIASHPNYEHQHTWKRSYENSDGEIGFSVVNLKQPGKFKKVVLQPRKDLEKLRKYIRELCLLLEQNFRIPVVSKVK